MKLFEEYVRTDEVTFKHARGKSVMPGKEFHLYHEIIYFIDGKAELITESLHVPLSPKTLIVIPKETYHQLKITGDEEDYHRCLLNFGESPISDAVNTVAIIRADSETEYLFGKLTRSGDIKEKELLLSSVLLLLLSKIADEKDNTPQVGSQNPVILRCVEHIDKNLGESLSIEDIARLLSISPSSLSHLFKKEMNTSLHRYILKKRLIAAYHKLCSGESATSVSLECGFNDYSGFYKQYKKMFGHPPSQK